MKVLDLFSGIGGFSLGLERAGMETVAFCENDKPCRKVLRKHWLDIPIHEDVRTLDGKQYRGTVGLICGGYPCQPFSVAGKRKGKEDDRHLWPEFFRIIRECQPDWVLAENVAGHINMGLDEVLADLEGAGYSTQSFVIPACAIDAPHRRDRVWIVGHANEPGHDRAKEPGAHSAQVRQGLPDHIGNAGSRQEVMADPAISRRKTFPEERTEQIEKRGPDSTSPRGRAISDATGQRRREARTDSQRPKERTAGRSNVSHTELKHDDGSGYGTSEIRREQFESSRIQGRWEWDPEPELGRVATGIPNRVDRLRQLGNAVVPQIPEIIGRAIMVSTGGN